MSNKPDLKSKEYQAWQAWLHEAEETAVKPGKPGNGRVTGLWIALVILVAITGAVCLAVFGQPHNEVFYIVATPTAGPAVHIRFLCYTNGPQLLPDMGVTWVRENGQTVTDSTDGTGCTMIPANEPVGVFDHVHQTTHWVWPGALPVCVDIAGGGISSGNLCPPG